MSLCESLHQPWYNSLWLTGLKAPVNYLTVESRNWSNKVLPFQWCRALPNPQLSSWTADPRCSLCPVYSQRQIPFCPVSSGHSTHPVAINKVVQTSHAETGPLDYLVLSQEEETCFSNTQRINTCKQHCLLFPTTVHKINTTKRVTTQQTEMNTVLVNGFK